MNELLLLTDGSVNTQSKMGYEAYFAVFEQGAISGFVEKVCESEAI